LARPERKVSNVSDYGDVVATVEEVHRFPIDDAIVLFGHIVNKGAKTVSVDPAAITIGIADRQYPSAFVDCASAVNPGQTIKFGVIGQGDVDGGRAHLAIRNTFRVLLPKYSAPASSPAPAQPPGLSNVMELMVQKYLNANDGDETYVRVPASKEFYVFTTSVIEPDRASVGAYEQGGKGTDPPGENRSVKRRVKTERNQPGTQTNVERHGAAGEAQDAGFARSVGQWQ
jgi:hypothetical protein